MNYLTNYYKNLAEQLQEKVNRLTILLEEAMAASPESVSDASDYSSAVAPPQQQAPPQQGPGQNNKPMEGDGLAPGYQKPHKQGPKSEEWKKWIQQPGRWHKGNPHPFGSPQFYQWEWEYYETPPV